LAARPRRDGDACVGQLVERHAGHVDRVEAEPRREVGGGGRLVGLPQQRLDQPKLDQIVDRLSAGWRLAAPSRNACWDVTGRHASPTSTVPLYESTRQVPARSTKGGRPARYCNVFVTSA